MHIYETLESLNQTEPAPKGRCVMQAKVPMLLGLGTFYYFSIPCLKANTLPKKINK